MSKANLNAIEGYEYLTVATKEKLEREMMNIEFTQKGLNGRGERIKKILATKKVKKNGNKKEEAGKNKK